MSHAGETENAPLQEEPYLVVAALADGERVDPAALKMALADQDVRDYLVDLIALRDAVGTLSASADINWQQRRRLRRRAGWISAAAAILISVTAAYFAGQRTAAAQALAAPTIETAVDLGARPAAPRPTEVVPLRPGVNWTETSGGQ